MNTNITILENTFIPVVLSECHYWGPTNQFLKDVINLNINLIDCSHILQLLKDSMFKVQVSLRHVLRYVLVQFFFAT